MKLCDFEVGLDKPLFLIAGPCVIESEQMAMQTSTRLKEITSKLGIPFIYKSSFDKAICSLSVTAASKAKSWRSNTRVKTRFRTSVYVWVCSWLLSNSLATLLV